MEKYAPNCNFLFILKFMKINNSLLKTIHISTDAAINFLINWAVCMRGTDHMNVV